MKRSSDQTESRIAAVVVAAALLTTACTAGQGAASATPETTPRASTTPAPSLAASSAGASTSPSPTVAALTWTPASLGEDWPAPVRSEPVGGSSVVPILHRKVDGDYENGRYRDPTGDHGSEVFPWADITELKLIYRAGLSIDLVSDPEPAVDPTEQWIAYGVVVDEDGDGVPDWRYGTDNLPVDATGEWPHRWWITDLHTGRTEWATGGGNSVGKTMFYGGPGRLIFGSDTTGGGTASGLPESFYAWAAVIEDGRVVATDYAPNVGWLLPSPDAKP